MGKLSLMLIGLISDTHIPEAGKELPPKVFQAFKDVDLILHGGDMHDIQVLDWLETLAPVKAARGNGDMMGRGDVPPDPRVKQTQVLTLEGLRVGMVHDFPEPTEADWERLPVFMEHFFGETVDIVVCGHTHRVSILQHEKTLIVNPGSVLVPNNRRGELGTVALMEISGGVPSVEVVQL